ncbi:SGNH/GDSL hydrolase family protein, partial [Patescibacteria group bacterium]|nr:SGNH/GDSL hydrolase family protein [Patescibacteria group bacterium]
NVYQGNIMRFCKVDMVFNVGNSLVCPLLSFFGFSSTNILSVQERLEQDSTHSGRIFQAINNIPFDLILIESFGHNPLSDHPLEEGLRLQKEALDKIVATITQKHPRSSIIFMTTIAPNKQRYAEGVVNLTTEKRQQWANERISYIKNHIDFAKSHNIPLINIYEASLDKEGDGNLDYINSNDFIHPSPTGIYFISEEIAKFLYNNKFF